MSLCTYQSIKNFKIHQIILNINIKLMYNSFIYEKRQKQRNKSETEIKNTFSERKRQLGIRNKMVERYNKRVENFIYKMEENPIQIIDYKNTLEETPEKYKHRSSKYDFKFRKSNWDMLQKSYCHEQNGRSIASQSLYSPAKEDKFRQRSKQKQIHQRPMRFNYQPKFLKKIKTKNQNFRKIDEQENDSQRRDGTIDDSASQDDAFSVASRLSRKILFPGIGISSIKAKTIHKQDQGTRKQTLQLQDNKPINKLYFKAVVDLCHKQKRLSRTARDILHKCKLVNFKYTNDESQKDMFESYHNKQQ